MDYAMHHPFAGPRMRDIARQMGETGVHFTTPMMQLQDPKQTKVLLVTAGDWSKSHQGKWSDAVSKAGVLSAGMEGSETTLTCTVSTEGTEG